ncbi:MAG: hypothetical protein ACR2KQ_05240 [Actinomycetota bacterium]
MGDRRDDGASRHGSLRPASLTSPLRYLWAAPGSIVGLLLALFFERRCVRDGVLLAEGAGWLRRLGWRYRAITFGHVVLCVDTMDERTWRHELAHVDQFGRWGIFFLVSYPLASLVAKAGGGHHYRDNRFEIAARRRERVRGTTVDGWP